jgi:GNAT superfamily N-acetyltransferase
MGVRGIGTYVAYLLPNGTAFLLSGQPTNEEGVAEAINPDITNPEFSHQQQIGDYLYVARYWSKGLKITAYHGNKQIGYAELMYQSAPFDDFADPKTTPKRVWLESEWTKVDPKYQRQGIMSTMYAYAKMLGNSVKPSQTRSDDAKAAWKSWRDAGDAQHLTREGVVEAFGPLPREKQQIRLGRHTVDIERVGEDKDYFSFAWHDSQGQEHYQEVPVGDLGSYDDLIDRIKDEIRYQERQYTDQGVAEDLDANQKRVGQLGPTEKVKNNNIGKLVGANESVEQLGELKKSTVKSYADKKQAELDDVPPMPFKKPGMSKAEHEKAAKGMTGALARLSGKKPTSESVKEGQEDLDAILRIVRK